MDDKLISAMEAELALLDAKAAAVRSVVELYRSENVLAQPLTMKAAPSPATTKPSSSGTVMDAIQRVARSLVVNAAGVPVPSTEILKVVEAEGIKIEGAVPRNTVSSALSRSEEFQANGRSGWTLKEMKSGAMAPNETGEALTSPDADEALTSSDKSEEEDLVG